ncbi:MAG: hypothetical protein HY670_11455, partial [Chloroflexi bacterium]|nr:hypothetical protein [Chloroflexota bacterium]
MVEVLPLTWVVENPARAVVTVSVILLLYQACLPQGLTLDPAARHIEWRVIPSAGFHVSRSDVVGNLLPYGVFGHFVFLASWRRHRRLARAGAVSFLGTLGMAFSVEGVEYFNLYRESAVWDLISAGMGATLALLTGAVYACFFADRLSAYCREEIRCR